MQRHHLKQFDRQALAATWILAAGEAGEALVIPPRWNSTHLCVAVDGGAEVEFFDQNDKKITVHALMPGAFVFAPIPPTVKAVTPKAKAGKWAIPPVVKVEVRIQHVSRARAHFRVPSVPGLSAPISA